MSIAIVVYSFYFCGFSIDADLRTSGYEYSYIDEHEISKNEPHREVIEAPEQQRLLAPTVFVKLPEARY